MQATLIGLLPHKKLACEHLGLSGWELTYIHKVGQLFTYYLVSTFLLLPAPTVHKSSPRHTGQVDEYCSQRWMHMVWKSWLQGIFSVPSRNTLWQMAQIGSSVWMSTPKVESWYKTMVNGVLRCHKTGQVESIWSWRKRVKHGRVGLALLHSSTFCAMVEGERCGGAQSWTLVMCGVKGSLYIRSNGGRNVGSAIFDCCWLILKFKDIKEQWCEQNVLSSISIFRRWESIQSCSNWCGSYWFWTCKYSRACGWHTWCMLCRCQT